MKTNTPDMNIANQINAALADIRATLIELSETKNDVDTAWKGRFQLDLAIKMIREHRDGTRSQPWSDRKHLVAEEFS